MTIRAPNAPLSATSVYHATLAVLLFFLAGSTFALGVFIPQVEAFAHPRHHLNGVWETAMGTMHFLSAPIMIAASLYLDAGQSVRLSDPQVPRHATKTFRLRLLNVICVVAFASFAVSANGAAHSSRFLLFFGVAMQAFPLAILYLTCVQTLLVWIPSHAGIAVGIGHVAFGLGTIGLTQLFSVLITQANPVTAIYLASVILAAGALLPSVLIRWPSEQDVPEHEEQDPLLQHFRPVEKIPWYHLIWMPNFWLYLITIFSTSASYMLNPYYFKLGQLFQRPLEQLVLLFNLSNLAATFFGLFATALTDFARFGYGFFFSGSKNIMMLFMALQTVCFFLSIFVNNSLNFVGFVIIKAALKVIVTCHVGCAALLARDLFGSSNSCVVFGFGAGLALGSGEAASAWLMAAVEAVVGSISVPSDYNAFYWIAVMWSVIGLLSTAMVQRHKNTHRYEFLL